MGQAAPTPRPVGLDDGTHPKDNAHRLDEHKGALVGQAVLVDGRQAVSEVVVGQHDEVVSVGSDAKPGGLSRGDKRLGIKRANRLQRNAMVRKTRCGLLGCNVEGGPKSRFSRRKSRGFASEPTETTSSC